MGRHWRAPFFVENAATGTCLTDSDRLVFAPPDEANDVGLHLDGERLAAKSNDRAQRALTHAGNSPAQGVQGSVWTGLQKRRWKLRDHETPPRGQPLCVQDAWAAR